MTWVYPELFLLLSSANTYTAKMKASSWFPSLISQYIHSRPKYESTSLQDLKESLRVSTWILKARQKIQVTEHRKSTGPPSGPPLPTLEEPWGFRRGTFWPFPFHTSPHFRFSCASAVLPTREGLLPGSVITTTESIRVTASKADASSPTSVEFPRLALSSLRATVSCKQEH